MEENYLKEREIKIDEIYLDPNNPRFWVDSTTKKIPDSKVSNEKIQDRTFQAMYKYGVNELYFSILRNGFLPLDRIVVREIDNLPNKYVVVEGNRRVTALKKLREDIQNDLIDEEGIDETHLEKILEKTEKLKVLEYTGKDKEDISWLLQGIRHISGIKDWGPAQQARLLVDQVDSAGFSFTHAGQQFGISAQKVGRLYRGFKALDQMKNDEEFQAKASNKYFTLFEEVIRSSVVRDWLGWDNKENEFKELSNLKRFYSWIIPCEDENGELMNQRRIHDPRQIKRLAEVIASKDERILNKFEEGIYSIEQASDKVALVNDRITIEDAFERIERILQDISQSTLQEEPQLCLQLIESVESKIATLKKMVQAITLK